MIHPDTELRFIHSDIGYGVFATAPIPRGTVLWALCRLDRIFTPAELAALPLPYLPIVKKMPTVNADQNQVLCWDHARYLNHNCRPSMRGLGSESRSRCTTSRRATISPANTAPLTCNAADALPVRRVRLSPHDRPG